MGNFPPQYEKFKVGRKLNDRTVQNFGHWLASQADRGDELAAVALFVADDVSSPVPDDWATWDMYLIEVGATERERALVRVAHEKWSLTKPAGIGLY